jgi:hypothetical protein
VRASVLDGCRCHGVCEVDCASDPDVQTIADVDLPAFVESSIFMEMTDKWAL